MSVFKDKRVLLTGASSGIGEALAVALGREGARVLLFARRARELGQVADQVRAVGGEALEVPGDVTRQSDLEAAVGLARAHWGGLDVVIANAGVSGHMPLEELAPDRAARVVEINLTGAMRTVLAALPLLLAQGSGQVVGVASPSGARGLPGAGVYSASKAGLTRFLESLRGPCRRRGVYVTIVHPGYVRTAMSAGLVGGRAGELSPERAARAILKAAVARRRSCTFPWQMALLARVAATLPDWLFDRLATRVRG